MKLLPPVEIAAAIGSVVERSCGIERQEAVTSAARLLGFQRTGTELESTIDTVLDSMLKKGILTVQGKFVLLKKEVRRRLYFSLGYCAAISALSHFLP